MAMALNCPQRGDNLRLPQTDSRKSQRHGKNKGGWVAAAVVAFVVCLVAGYLLFDRATPSHPSNPGESKAPPPAQGQSAPAAVFYVPFCQRDFTAKAERRADISELQAAGGLIYLLQRPQAAPPFSCSAYYLALGLDVNAVSAQSGLTPLHYAIKANAPSKVQFVITHGADLHKKAGTHHLEPMGYAYYLALNHRKINRNAIIAIINNALTNASP